MRSSLKHRVTVLAVAVMTAAALFAVPVGPAGATDAPNRVVVTDPGDTGEPGQLRWAFESVADGGTVQIKVDGPIRLGDVIEVAKAVTVRGGGALVDVDTDGFFVTSTGALTLVDLTLYHDRRHWDARFGFTAIEVSGGEVTLSDVTVTTFARSAIRVDGGSLTLNEASAVTMNQNYHPGGGILANYGTIVLNDSSTVSDNAALRFPVPLVPPYGYLAQGGGIANFHGSLTLNDAASVAGNTVELLDYHAALGQGGGVYNYRGAVTLNDTAAITGHTAEVGGGIYNYQGAVTLNDAATIAGNTTLSDGGGGILNTRWESRPASVTLNDTAVITGNTSPSGLGGGIRSMYGASVTLNDDAVVTGNSQPDIFAG